MPCPSFLLSRGTVVRGFRVLGLRLAACLGIGLGGMADGAEVLHGRAVHPQILAVRVRGMGVMAAGAFEPSVAQVFRGNLGDLGVDLGQPVGMADMTADRGHAEPALLRGLVTGKADGRGSGVGLVGLRVQFLGVRLDGQDERALGLMKRMTAGAGQSVMAAGCGERPWVRQESRLR